MSKTLKQKLANIKQRSVRKIQSALSGSSYLGKPVFDTKAPKFDANDRIKISQYGGIPVINTMVRDLGLADEINDSISLLSAYRPYTEADHVLNIAYSGLCGGENLQDLETLRNDPYYLESLGVKMTPDPTTAGDFCRRFDAGGIVKLQEAINGTRKKVWQQHSSTNEGFFNEARIDADGVLVQTTGSCKEGMDISYKGGWGYHPLLISLANTAENLYIINRTGNVASHHNAADWIEESVKLCKEGGFDKVRVRGDSDFALTSNFDKWDSDFKFVFSYDAMPNLVGIANSIEDEDSIEEQAAWSELVRIAEKEIERKRPIDVKQQMVEIRGYPEMKLVKEHQAEFDYQPGKCKTAYRMIVIRKEIEHRKKGELLFPEYRYFFYITNDREKTADEIIKEAGERCNQENTVNQQLQNGVHALKAPLDNLESNWAWMVCAGLAWALKAWTGLLLPISPRWRTKHQQEQGTILRIEMKRFVRDFIQIPIQVVRTSRKLILKISGYRLGSNSMMRLMAQHE